MKLIISIAFFCFYSPSFSQQNNTLLWRISHKNNNEYSYLYGTMHVAVQKHNSFYDSVYAAIANTESFYGELDFFKISMLDVEDGYYEKKLSILDSLMETPGWKKVITAFNKMNGTTVAVDDKGGYIQAASKVSAEQYEREAGEEVIDLNLAKLSKKLGKKMGGLETFTFQLDMFYELLKVKVNDTLVTNMDENKLNKALKEFYFQQETDSIATILGNVPLNYRQIIFDNRNLTMTDSIIKILPQRTAFVAVGAGHLFGTKGIITLLQQQGYTVIPVKGQQKIYIKTFTNCLELIKKTITTLIEGRIKD